MIDGKVIMDIEAEKAIKANSNSDTTLATTVSGLSETVNTLSAKVPNATLPTAAGNYQLTVAVDGETVTYSWTAIE